MRILLLDIEVAPLVAHAWGLFDQNIGIPQIRQSGYTLCWSAKWLGQSKVYSASRFKTTAKKMLKPMHDLISEADAIVTYNGVNFDMKLLHKDFLIHGFKPPSPYKNIDLLRVMRSKFRFASNKLNFVSKELGIGQKLDTGGHQLWIDCMNGDETAFKKMLKYNAQDVRLLEKLYVKVLPWIGNHPNVGLYNEAEEACPNCGGHHLQRRGFARTTAGKYARFQCMDCGTWSKSGFTDTSREQRKKLLRPA
jgi:predicted RNA-binding Zn-ribbon protein involved in translation (DUF1610 family)